MQPKLILSYFPWIRTAYYNTHLPFIVTRHASGSLSQEDTSHSDTKQLPRKRPATSKLHTLIMFLTNILALFPWRWYLCGNKPKKQELRETHTIPNSVKKNWKSYYKMEHQEKLKICVTTAFQSCASRMHDTIMRRLKGKCGGEHAQWIAIYVSSKAHSAGKSTPVPYLP